MELLNTLSAEVVRRISGQLLTEAQIKSITSHAVGKYFADLLPETGDKKTAREKVEAARMHISEASAIIGEMKGELDTQMSQLTLLIEEIEEKKTLADKYETLAKTNREQFDAFRSEMEEAVREELVEQANKNIGMRRFVSFILWAITLFLGAAVGHNFADIVNFVKGLFA